MRIYIRRLKTTTLAASTCVFVFPRKRPSSHVPFPHVPRHLCSGPGRRALPPRSAEPCLHGAPGHSPRCRDRSCEQETPDPPGRGAAAATTGARGVGGNSVSGFPSSPPLPGKTQLFPPDRGPYLRRPSGPTAPRGRGGPGARVPVRPSRPRGGQGPSGNAGSGRAGCAPPRGPSAPPGSSAPRTRSPSRGPGKDARGAGRLLRGCERRGAPGAILSPERSARGGRAHPAPCTRHPLRSRKTTGAGLPPPPLPSRREPDFLYLDRGGGLYAKGARPGSRNRLGPAGGGAHRLGPPRAHAALGGRRRRGDSRAGPGRALQLPPDGTPCPAASGSLPGAPPAAPGAASRAAGAGGQARGSGSPGRPSCAAPGTPLFPGAPGGRRGRHRCLVCAWQRAGKSRAGERGSPSPPGRKPPPDACPGSGPRPHGPAAGPGASGTLPSGAFCLFVFPSPSLHPRPGSFPENCIPLLPATPARIRPSVFGELV